jgi:hypothetical protein
VLRKKMYSYQCPYCEKAFTTIDFLEKHILRRHMGELKEDAESDHQVELSNRFKI